MSPYALYLGLYSLLVFALALAAYLLNVPGAWVVGGAILLIGLGLGVAALKATPVEPASRDDAPES
jgi:hypothetical protein